MSTYLQQKKVPKKESFEKYKKSPILLTTRGHTQMKQNKTKNKTLSHAAATHNKKV